MTKKRRSLKQLSDKPSTNVESDDSDCDQKKKEDLGKRRVLRSRNSAVKPAEEICPKKPRETDCKKASDKGLDAYDADSETDLKLNKKSSADDTSSDCDEFVLMKPKLTLTKLKALSPVTTTENTSASRKTTSRRNLKNLKDFSVNLEDCMQPGDNTERMHQTPGNITSLTEERRHNDQENVTPPDIHSTPCLVKVAKNLDKSLFGFNGESDEMEKKQLNYSSTKMDGVSEPLSPSVVNNSNLSSTSFSGKTYSRSKRKNDAPVEADFTTTAEATTKKKRSKKKKKDEEPNSDDLRRENEMWENIRQQFREVDMHELVIE